MTIEIRAMELLCSRICHDLISPVGAIRNGLEVIEDIDDNVTGDEFRGEATQLIAHAAAQADGRLRMFRLVYGQAGREVSGFGDARAAARAWFDAGRTRLEWPVGAPPEHAARRRGAAKTLLGTLILADEALTHGGTVSVDGDASDVGGGVTVTAVGRPGSLSAEALSALNGETPLDAVTPRTIHAYVMGRFAVTYGIRVVHRPVAPERLTLALSW